MMALIEFHSKHLDPKDDINYTEAAIIAQNSRTKMEIIEKSFIFGFTQKGKMDTNFKKIPILNIQMMSDERWNELAARCRREDQYHG